MTENTTRRISLTPKAKKELDDLCKRFRTTQIGALEGLIEWLTSKDEMVQMLALGLPSKEGEDDIVGLMYLRQIEEQAGQGGARGAIARAIARGLARRQGRKGTRRKASGESQ